MKKTRFAAMAAALIGAGAVICFVLSQMIAGGCASERRDNGETVKLPPPKYDGKLSLERTLSQRRSVREYVGRPLTLAEVGQLLWAAQGVTDRQRGFRTAPSAGALYPLELYLAVGNVSEIEPGVYKYRAHEHELHRVRKGDIRGELSAGAVQQTWIAQAPAVVVFSAVYQRTTTKYGDRGIRYVHIEVGHAAQNLCLQAVSLNLGAAVVGAFDDGRVREILNAPSNELPLYIVPVGVM